VTYGDITESDSTKPRDVTLTHPVDHLSQQRLDYIFLGLKQRQNEIFLDITSPASKKSKKKDLKLAKLEESPKKKTKKGKEQVSLVSICADYWLNIIIIIIVVVGGKRSSVGQSSERLDESSPFLHR